MKQRWCFAAPSPTLTEASFSRCVRSFCQWVTQTPFDHWSILSRKMNPVWDFHAFHAFSFVWSDCFLHTVNRSRVLRQRLIWRFYRKTWKRNSQSFYVTLGDSVCDHRDAQNDARNIRVFVSLDHLQTKFFFRTRRQTTVGRPALLKGTNQGRIQTSKCCCTKFHVDNTADEIKLAAPPPVNWSNLNFDTFLDSVSDGNMKSTTTWAFLFPAETAENWSESTGNCSVNNCVKFTPALIPVLGFETVNTSCLQEHSKNQWAARRFTNVCSVKSQKVTALKISRSYLPFIWQETLWRLNVFGARLCSMQGLSQNFSRRSRGEQGCFSGEPRGSWQSATTVILMQSWHSMIHYLALRWPQIPGRLPAVFPWPLALLLHQFQDTNAFILLACQCKRFLHCKDFEVLCNNSGYDDMFLITFMWKDESECSSFPGLTIFFQKVAWTTRLTNRSKTMHASGPKQLLRLFCFCLLPRKLLHIFHSQAQFMSFIRETYYIHQQGSVFNCFTLQLNCT